MNSKLDQLKQWTDVVADTGDIEAIKRYQPLDATTNPSLLYKAAQLPQYDTLLAESIAWGADKAGTRDAQIAAASDQFAVRIGQEILSIVPGKVSTEVDARLSFDTPATIAKAQQLISLYDSAGIGRERVLIKIAATWEGIKAAEQLERAGIHCNLTLLFSFAQAAACADAGVTLISPFVGRILDWHVKAAGGNVTFNAEEDPGVISVSDIYRYYKQHDYPTIVMGASFRNTGEIEALAGCDRLTISPALLEALAADNGELSRQLSSNDKVIHKAHQQRQQYTEAEFRYAFNDNAMATEKLAEGIRNFVKDQINLEQLINERFV